jgi:hypothetical protein
LLAEKRWKWNISGGFYSDELLLVLDLDFGCAWLVLVLGFGCAWLVLVLDLDFGCAWLVLVLVFCFDDILVLFPIV